MTVTHLAPPGPVEAARRVPDAALRAGRALGLPSGLADGSAARRRRHAVVVATGTAALPGLALLATVTGAGLPALPAVLLAPAALLAVAGVPVRAARLRAAAAAAGLVAVCCTAVCLSPATTEAHFSFFLAVLLLGLYRDWAVFPVALGVAVLWPDLVATAGLAAAAAPASVTGVVVLHAALVVAAAAVTVVAWALCDATTRRPAPVG